jgi:hypothetical protein
VLPIQLRDELSLKRNVQCKRGKEVCLDTIIEMMILKIMLKNGTTSESERFTNSCWFQALTTRSQRKQISMSINEKRSNKTENKKDKSTPK